MNQIYKIRRKSDGRFYRGKSRFTIHGTYFRKEQITHNIGWVISQCREEELELICYDISENDMIKIDTKITPELFFEIIERDKKINEILDD